MNRILDEDNTCQLLSTPYGHAHKWEDENGTTMVYIDHVQKINQIRKTDHSEAHKFAVGYEYLKDAEILFEDRSEPVYIESIHKHWYFGYYLMILYYTITDRGNKSHGSLFWANISCHHPTILESIEKNKSIKIIPKNILS